MDNYEESPEQTVASAAVAVEEGEQQAQLPPEGKGGPNWLKIGLFIVDVVANVVPGLLGEALGTISSEADSILAERERDIRAVPVEDRGNSRTVEEKPPAGRSLIVGYLILAVIALVVMPFVCTGTAYRWYEAALSTGLERPTTTEIDVELGGQRIDTDRSIKSQPMPSTTPLAAAEALPDNEDAYQGWFDDVNAQLADGFNRALLLDEAARQDESLRSDGIWKRQMRIALYSIQTAAQRVLAYPPPAKYSAFHDRMRAIAEVSDQMAAMYLQALDAGRSTRWTEFEALKLLLLQQLEEDCQNETFPCPAA